MSPLKHHRLLLVLLAVILAWGGYLRFVNLGLNTLASDEMNHFFVGQSLNATGEPLLPSGTTYTRGLAYSRLVALALPQFDQMEVAVRIPSAIIGSLALLLFAIIAWRVAGPWQAVIATVLLALYPEILRLSRFGRFYTMQLLVGLMAFYTGWKLIERPLTPDRFRARDLSRSWILALLTIAAFAYAATVQLTTFSVAAGFCLVIAIVGIRDLRLYGSDAWRWSVPWQLTMAGVLIALFLVIFRLDMVREILRDALTVPMWARLSSQNGPGPMSAYYRRLSSHFPLVVSLSPLIFIVAIIRFRRLGWYLLAWFAVPLALHSVVFPWKSERYVILAIPALLLATGIAGYEGARALRTYLERHLSSAGRFPAPRFIAGALVLLIGVGALITNPAFNIARRSVSIVDSDGWAESIAIMRKTPGLQSVPIGSAQPLVALHYWGRLDFTVQRALLESWSRDTTGGFDHPYRMKPMGSPDVYAGRPTLTTAEVIRNRFRNRKAVLVGIDQKYLTFDNVEPSLRESLEREAQELCQARCGSMRLYYWRFGGTGQDSLGTGSPSLPGGS